ncbi:MAG: hypothetical protein COB59_09505 [Rhodospirillaceae bacterium]|nr:MAG: hypothetical protein COB59_09505 [Rhodospirillaceae bacterium]
MDTVLSKAALLKPYLAAALTILIWGAMPTVTQIAVLDMDALAAGVLRTLLAGIFVAPFIFRSSFPKPKGRQQWQSLGVVALCGFVGFTLLFSVGSSMTSPLHSTLINSMNPFFTGLFGVLAVQLMPTKKWFLGMAISFSGVVYIVVAKDAAQGSSSVMGDILCLLSAMFVGLGYVNGSHLAKQIGTLAVTFWAVFVASVLQIPLILYVWDLQDVLAVSLNGWLALAYLSLGSTLVAYIAWYWALAHGGVTRIAPMQFLMPVVGLPLAVLVFGESLTIMLVGSAFLIVAGVYFSTKG